MDLYGLIGKQLSHSWSEKYFTEKFKREKVSAIYRLFPLTEIELLPTLVLDNPNLKGLNVTIPYKLAICPYLDAIEIEAKLAGSVNTVLIKKNRGSSKLIGYNTDIAGFSALLDKCLTKNINSALIIGTGGASKSVQHVLRAKGIDFTLISRETKKVSQLAFEMLFPSDIENNLLIINTSPVGMYPNIDEFPPIPYQYLTKNHVLIDLIYNPETTIFLQKGKEMGAHIMNGLTMLQVQADAAWKIWKKG